jgi:hypothetical protein
MHTDVRSGVEIAGQRPLGAPHTCRRLRTGALVRLAGALQFGAPLCIRVGGFEAGPVRVVYKLGLAPQGCRYLPSANQTWQRKRVGKSDNLSAAFLHVDVARFFATCVLSCKGASQTLIADNRSRPAGLTPINFHTCSVILDFVGCWHQRHVHRTFYQTLGLLLRPSYFRQGMFLQRACARDWYA